MGYSKRLKISMICKISKMQVFFQALQFASIKHTNQRRKGKDAAPYINHPIEVANILAQAGVKDYGVLAAAVLHDTVEDTDTTEAELEKEFGAKIKSIVMECSDDKSLDKVQRKKYQIEKALKVSHQAKLVKMADKISNNGGLFSDPPPKWSPDRVRGYFLWSQAVCANLKGANQLLDKQLNDIFDKSGINALSNEQKLWLLDEYYVGLMKQDQQ